MQLLFISAALLLVIDLSPPPLLGKIAFRTTPGEINHVEGTAYLDGTRLAASAVPLPSLKKGNRLETADGRIEVLLNPGTFLRLGKQTEVEFTSLDPARLELKIIKGDVLLEVVEPEERRYLSIMMGGSAATAFRRGIYELEAATSSLQVYAGKAEAEMAGEPTLRLQSGERATCKNHQIQRQKFDARKADALYAWSAHASEYEAAASYASRNISRESAKNSAWYWNTQLACWAFVPAAGIISGPFGWSFAAPGSHVPGASVLNGPIFHYLALVNPMDRPRILPLPSNGHWIDIAHSPRISPRDTGTSIDLGPGAPSILW